MSQTGRRLVQELAEDGQDPPARYMLREEDRPIGAASPPPPIPVVDLSRLSGPDGADELANLRSALQSWGLFLAIGHEIPIDEVLNVTKEFFHLPLEEKQKYSNLKDGQDFGLQGYGNDQVRTDDQILDWCDRLYLFVEPEDERNLAIWPGNPATFRDIVHDFSIRSKKVVTNVLQAMAKLLELNEDYFVNYFANKAITQARFCYYPRCTRPDLVFGLKPHSDASVITVLLPDQQVSGLQVLSDIGEWVNVPIVPHALLINMGDGMEIMSNGIFKSPVHRVVTNAEMERVSVVMFYTLNSEMELEPADDLVKERPRLYTKVTVKDYLDIFYRVFAQGKRPIDSVKM